MLTPTRREGNSLRRVGAIEARPRDGYEGICYQIIIRIPVTSRQSVTWEYDISHLQYLHPLPVVCLGDDRNRGNPDLAKYIFEVVTNGFKGFPLHVISDAGVDFCHFGIGVIQDS